MKSRRKMMFVRLVVGATVLTVVAFLSGYALVTDVAVASWVCVVSFIALALYAVSQGYLEESSLGVRIPQTRRLATIQPIYGDDASPSSNEFDAEYDEEYDDGWQREPLQRRALG
jgi:small-conductance mechanosensitive channel